MNVHRNIVPNSQKQGKKNPPTDKQNVVYPYNVLFGHTKRVLIYATTWKTPDNMMLNEKPVKYICL